MAYQSLYRRYRSRTFAEVLGQPHVTMALRTAVAEGRHGHAYLFSGPRGTGKTSTARVLAKALNCENLQGGEPCCACASCRAIEDGTSFDLHELDAASHNKVDDIRDLISKVHLGSPGRTKVYILDEVHMLSSGAENALLKTLEEPPPHVVFVLATTEPQKVVPTIRSRSQHFEFHLLPAEVLADHVRFVIADAGLEVDDDAIDYVLRQGGGSARDTLSALDLVAAAGGVPRGDDVAASVLQAVADRDPGAAIAAVQEGLEIGREPRTIGEDTLGLLRNAFLASMGASLAHLNDRGQELAQQVGSTLGPAAVTRSLELIGTALVEMRQAPDPRVPLEVALLRLTRAELDRSPGALVARIDQLERQVAELLARGPASAPAEASAPSHLAPPAPAAPTPQDPAASSAPPAPGARGPATSPAASPGPDTGPATGAPAGPDTEPAAPSQGRRTGSAETAARPTPPAEAPAPPPRRRPPEGSGRRPAPPDGPGPAVTNGRRARTPAETSSSPVPDGPTPAQAAPVVIDLTSATAALADQLDDLSQRARVRFKGGRVLDVTDSTIRFGVPNSIHRDRCREVTGEVEQALSAHFGGPVNVDVVVDDESTAPPDPAKPRPQAPPPSDHDEADDIGPIDQLDDATDHTGTGVDRLTRAFPGSQVIDNPTD
ncbi:MAG: DNA polymerase III subunit gamma/tau [Acidimicrobiales bacterium]